MASNNVADLFVATLETGRRQAYLWHRRRQFERLFIHRGAAPSRYHRMDPCPATRRSQPLRPPVKPR